MNKIMYKTLFYVQLLKNKKKYFGKMLVYPPPLVIPTKFLLFQMFDIKALLFM